MVEAHHVKSRLGITDSADSLVGRKGRVPRLKWEISHAELLAGLTDNIRRTVARYLAEGYPDHGEDVAVFA